MIAAHGGVPNWVSPKMAALRVQMGSIQGEAADNHSGGVQPVARSPYRWRAGSVGRLVALYLMVREVANAGVE